MEPKSFSIDLSAVHRGMSPGKALTGREVLDPLVDAYLIGDQSYRRVDDFTLVHVMDYEALQPYRLTIRRADLVCIQITIAGTYVRWTPDRPHTVQSASTHITNAPVSVSSLKPGQKLRGIWIACDRKSFVHRYALQMDQVPEPYRPIFASAAGMSNALTLPTMAPNIMAVEQILACRWGEPLNSLYVNAKAVEIICNLVAQIQTSASVPSSRFPEADLKRSEAVAAAAEIYRRDFRNPPTVDKLAFRVGLNRNELTEGFRGQFGVTPRAYSLSLRMKEAQNLLQGGALSISEVARRVGYASYGSFARAYAAFHGAPPSGGPLQEEEP